MRKEFAATVRVVTVPRIAPKRRYLSLEEEALVLDQAHQDATDVSSSLDETNRLLEVSDALEDLAVVAANIRQASPTEIGLIQTAGQMAVAGTDNEPEIMLPTMESFQEGQSIACESIREKAVALWKNLQEFLSRIWDKIEAFFRINVVVGTLTARLEATLSALKSGRGEGATGGPISISALERQLTYKGKIVRDQNVMFEALTNTANVAKFIYGNYADQVLKAGEKIEHALNGYTVDKTDETMNSLVHELSSIQFAGIPGGHALGDEDGFQAQATDAFLGGGTLVAKTYRATSGDNALVALDRIRHTGLFLEKGDADSFGYDATFGIPRLIEAARMVSAALALLAVIEQFHKTKFKQMKLMGDRLKKASTKAVSEMERVTVGDEGGDSISEFRGALNMNTTFARWTQMPAIPFYSHILSSARATLFLAQHAMSNKGAYEGQDFQAA